eukprot:TRINITY_DN107974_c0_g1_i1.p1 TRINITY_DN107974_c0_g1~~TRINITY_DN107974_c0_g1_i1.p1  ORF type:complete len:272 (+),score=58.99 TRINITY_DN107974_c0_g1_i1:25-816(+)
MALMGVRLSTLVVIAHLCHDAHLSCRGEAADAESLSSATVRALHAELDKDLDGNVTLEEIIAVSAAISQARARKYAGSFVRALDGDRDGLISWSELMKHQSMSMARRSPAEKEKMIADDKVQFAASDKDGDGLLNSDEAAAMFFPHTDQAVMDVWTKRLLDKLDEDNDGRLNSAEFAKNSLDYTAEDFASFDANDDGHLDSGELRPHQSGQYRLQKSMEELVRLADTDGNGHLSSSEVENARESIRQTEAHDYLLQWATHLEL